MLKRVFKRKPNLYGRGAKDQQYDDSDGHCERKVDLLIPAPRDLLPQSLRKEKEAILIRGGAAPRTTLLMLLTP